MDTCGGRRLMAGFMLLASASPRRHEILTQLGVAHGVLHVPAPEGEDEPRLAHEPAVEYVCRTARNKALHAHAWLHAGGRPASIPPDWPIQWHQCPILCADTTVTVDGQVLGKPADEADAARMLRLLSGRRHQVLTAVALWARGRLWEALSASDVDVEALAEPDIAAYIASGEPFGKAGAYAIQGRAAAFITRLEGSYTGVMGLPAHETMMLLRSAAA
ncbi:nucleoside triphosphate pyrophosphatase [Castellaniella sp.]|uniref:Maf family protein n=1 Tax=Castellaniella sp. TaxID=1955812 RepID=UPI00355CA172